MKSIFKGRISAAILSITFLSTIMISCESSTEPGTVPNEVEAYQKIISTAVHSNAVGFASVFDSMFVDADSRQEFLRAFINFNRYLPDSSGYFFVNNYQGIDIAHGTMLSLQGQDRYNVQDINGKFYVHDILSNAKNGIKEFVSYYFNNPTTGNVEQKYTYAEGVGSYDYALCSGFYLAKEEAYVDPLDINKRVVEATVGTFAYGASKIFEKFITNRGDQIKFFRKFVDRIRYFPDSTGYFYIIDMNGIMIANAANKSLNSTNQYDLQDTKGQFVVHNMINMANTTGGGFIDYYWDNPATNQNELKKGYIERVKGTNYIIGSGVYLN